ncbi:MAG TPA: UPF0147 family protein [Candidatus Methanoperedens sp.]|nr:UPF0147 family protein [Candidatus Methanoperedens sp. BLZ2]KAB2943452.1 MAG: UPF0147 family protein [Candidatus Methanoperedens sp.]MBZ0176435.1 UPF0147 family protein [Candidatus Methanoperedens nitroreducens]MCX9078628.1 UPF0147 family protein [Candidatus Methanoperedens sp.]MCX9086674.1 UPF0147 family protein [Candidatus Methanoperedens sp.]
MITVSENLSEIIKQCTEVLDRIISDDSVPRNIRRSADNIKNVLSNEKQPISKRAAIVISNLDDIGNDPNIPIHTRTLIWGLSSKLESIPVDR